MAGGHMNYYEILVESQENDLDANLAKAAEAISEATALVFTAGAGMGVDSGLPDFRGKEGFWNAYPIYQEMGLDFSDIARPQWFNDDPEMAWGFYGHRMNMYRDAEPHGGYKVLHELAQEKDHFVVTSNVDGLFKKAGFNDEHIWEIHGSIHHLQRQNVTEYYHEGMWQCTNPIIPADDFHVDVDLKTCKAVGDLPRDKDGNLLRPNVLMFLDFNWSPVREAIQQDNFEQWKEQADLSKLVVIECGAGTALPSIRCKGERLVDEFDGKLVRINPEEYRALNNIGIPLGAEEALVSINTLIFERT